MKSNLKQLLEIPRAKLNKKFQESRVKLILWLNVTYLILCPIFILSEKMGSGQYVPHWLLGWVYAIVWITNLICFLTYWNYRKWVLWREKIIPEKYLKSKYLGENIKKSALFSLMGMSFLNMIGFGNPSNDSILTDYAFGHSLILIATIITNRRTAFIWFLIVVGNLCFVSFSRGYNYQYNYLTPQESANYQKALEANEPKAKERHAILKENGLNPPHVSRYFNVWMVFLIQAIIISYYYNGITSKVFDELPEVTQEIDDAIRLAHEQELEKFELEKVKAFAEISLLKSQNNPHFLFNVLNFLHIKAQKVDTNLADAVLTLAKLMRHMLNDGQKEDIPLNDEILAIKDFIKIMQLRFDNELKVKLDIKGDLKSVKIPPLVLLGFVENAFKHGDNFDENNPMEISIVADKKLFFFCKNKINKIEKALSTGLGNKNIEKRLALTYQNKYKLDIKPSSDIFEVRLELEFS
jgi:two-component system, LytTR family, sensor kinase